MVYGDIINGIKSIIYPSWFDINQNPIPISHTKFYVGNTLINFIVELILILVESPVVFPICNPMSLFSFKTPLGRVQ